MSLCVFPRIKPDTYSFYHCISRVVDGRFIFALRHGRSGPAEKFIAMTSRSLSRSSKQRIGYKRKSGTTALNSLVQRPYGFFVICVFADSDRNSPVPRSTIRAPARPRSFFSGDAVAKPRFPSIGSRTSLHLEGLRDGRPSPARKIAIPPSPSFDRSIVIFLRNTFSSSFEPSDHHLFFN